MSKRLNFRQRKFVTNLPAKDCGSYLGYPEGNEVTSVVALYLQLNEVLTGVMAEIEQQSVDPLSVAADVLCEFLEVAFHLILYVRNIYPAVVFERRKKYNVPVQMCCHPELNQYILDVLQSVKSLLEKGQVQRIALVISNKNYEPVERFVFEVGNPEDESMSKDNFLLNTEAALRGFLLKINVCETMLSPTPPDCTFAILVYTKESSMLQLCEDQKAQDFPWVHADTAAVRMEGATMVPLKSNTSGLVKMQLFVEQCNKVSS